MKIKLPAAGVAATRALRRAATAGPLAPITKKAKGVLLKQLSQHRNVGAGTNGLMTFGARLSIKGTITEKIALKPSDPLISTDERRSKSGPDVAWVKLGLTVGAGASIAPALNVGLSPSLGFSGDVQLVAVMPSEKNVKLDNLRETLADHGSAALVVLDPDRLAAGEYPPGTEMMARGKGSTKLGLNLGASARLPLAEGRVGVYGSALHEQVFRKSIKVLEHGRVYVEVSRNAATTGQSSAGVNSRLRPCRRPGRQTNQRPALHHRGVEL